MISAIYEFALTTGANRVVRGSRIEHVCGDPSLGPEKDYAFGMQIVKAALDAIATPVGGPTLFFSEGGSASSEGGSARLPNLPPSDAPAKPALEAR